MSREFIDAQLAAGLQPHSQGSLGPSERKPPAAGKVGGARGGGARVAAVPRVKLKLQYPAGMYPSKRCAKAFDLPLRPDV